ncbi:hypothetical protein EJ04DRAFT_485358 [Polyplosphaeria fusca]|uniref:AA9 family lytic polysaccharide monooxygenase n=1 Tax=Polyplosphaeria fusca TaxID=682080 RepID=A0A9P4V781_9PLEO|nr:hypothetical protein EJ04DRAFT_485358 [Polyplosphaeria fusca]
MKGQSLLLALAALPASLAHTVWTDFYVDGVGQGDAVAIRMRKDPKTASFPVEDLSSNDMACNVDGEKGVSLVSTVSDGAMLTFEMRSYPNDPSMQPLDRGHKGPCAVYLKKVDSAIDDPGYGDGWFKILDYGYNKDDDQWCTDKLIDNKGLLSVALPKGLKGGYYLARPEVLALHNALKGDPQFYTGCAQIFIESTGDLVPESTVSIPGYVKAGEESVSYDIYNDDNSKYPVPGPAVAKLSSSSSAAGTQLKAQMTQNEGFKPKDAICENGDWFGFEVPSYSDEAGCWASGEDCWTQGKACYNDSPVTGNDPCQTWQDKCQAINDACNAKNFNGPPNKGKNLIPEAKTIDIGLVLPTSGGGVDSTPNTAADVKSSAPAAPQSSAPAYTSAGSEDGGFVLASSTPTAYATTPASSQAAPAPTEKPSCPESYYCVTSTTTVVKTEVVYTTVYKDTSRQGLHERRRR